MKIQIIKGLVESDQTVTKDGLSIFGVDFSGVASNLWALTWDSETETGEVEKANPQTNVSETSEAQIDSALGGVTLQAMLTRRQTKLDADTAAIIAEEEAVEAADLAADTRPEWQKNREDEYPPLEELIVALYDTSDKAALVTKRAAVKTKWPKDDSGPV